MFQFKAALLVGTVAANLQPHDYYVERFEGWRETFSHHPKGYFSGVF